MNDREREQWVNNDYRNNPRRSTAASARGDVVTAHELELFIENDADLYHRQFVPIVKNLVTKMARGVYDPKKGAKLFMYLMESGAKEYVKQCAPDTPWHEMFDVPTRRIAAANFEKEFRIEAKLGNYDSLLPKKYQK